MTSLESAMKTLMSSISSRSIPKEELDALVQQALEETGGEDGRETRKARWEFRLKEEILKLAATEGEALKNPNTDYYDRLRDRLDLVLTFTELDACEQTFPVTVLQDLLDTQTIRSCSRIFSWIEERADRLTKDMVPQKAKALILLRALNDLLRRLSKMGNTTVFCGRILTFLSGIFPLGERSGVNLRGDYGPMWDGPGLKKDQQPETKEEEREGVAPPAEDKMQVDEPEARKQEEQSVDFYSLFWSLQRPFSRPPLFVNPETLPSFKSAVEKVLPVIKEATSKERAMMGSRSSDANGASRSLKRKRVPEPGEETSKVSREYFFAKYLTSPELLELEIADTHFRRQFLFQLLILLHYLLSFTRSAKSSWMSLKNRSLQLDFTLDEENAKWVQTTIDTVTRDFLPSTFPNGVLFRDTVKTILEREKNWVDWKNKLCPVFDKEPWSALVDGRKVGLEEFTKPMREKMREEPPEWEHKLGSAPLTEIWAMGYRDLRDLERSPDPGSIDTYASKIKMEDRRIEMRRQTLARAAERLAQARAKANTPVPPVKDANGAAPAVPAQEDAGRSTPGNAASPPLHHPLPPKPGTTSMESPAPAAPAIVAPVPNPPAVPPVRVDVPASPAPDPIPINDDQINKFEENKHRWAWLCLRIAREEYLDQFGKIGTGDVLALEREIKKALAEKANPKPQKDDAEQHAPTGTTGEQDRGTSPSASNLKVPPAEGDVQMSGTPEVEGDVKMEER
ncbi:hypothetical protein GLOTRDRAFT_118437 [Gloeophyllum trabeum ATCC 11539]|uniref:THO complex subunit 1 transcription elongation factor-domain-containing protein n=1 Tax=Gloeophyllum trabeum (strain ATCC 11539 / FP-39264 / Madison 617) TaxID=670483 RepID=S7QKP9_GLOTA|nr:uncharacterized protein GLOTRDRAFT_118437 [Gloeophyllum trabeum ATCC 11539]EPQ59967.1 hypothetical protein GLOTRDRAFT_118437 [Gloeophyllum trabeum ATCC 11539]